VRCAVLAIPAGRMVVSLRPPVLRTHEDPLRSITVITRNPRNDRRPKTPGVCLSPRPHFIRSPRRPKPTATEEWSAAAIWRCAY
jgi:hypothetical protein